ncbi:Zinc finger protein 717 [Galemys pyrenaicus]|uniref:Zinc finger protein 717 n=1 Tax=Galemys pyrenaicus TaxID=202257 RepID=A0A8J5ZGU1_GALPY|nr:Zinc finger protein 717 [Galemys pyrenaicus]
MGHSEMGVPGTRSSSPGRRPAALRPHRSDTNRFPGRLRPARRTRRSRARRPRPGALLPPGAATKAGGPACACVRDLRARRRRPGPPSRGPSAGRAGRCASPLRTAGAPPPRAPPVRRAPRGAVPGAHRLVGSVSRGAADRLPAPSAQARGRPAPFPEAAEPPLRGRRRVLSGFRLRVGGRWGTRADACARRPRCPSPARWRESRGHAPEAAAAAATGDPLAGGLVAPEKGSSLSPGPRAALGRSGAASEGLRGMRPGKRVSWDRPRTGHRDDVHRVMWKSTWTWTPEAGVSSRSPFSPGPGHCINKPEVIIRLEQGTEPWTIEEPPNQSLSDVHTLDDLIKTNQENQGRDLWQVLFTNSKTSTKERTNLGKTFNLSSIYSLNLSLKNGNYTAMIPEEFDVCKNILSPCELDGLHARERPENPDVSGKSLRYPTFPSLHQMIQTLQQPFNFSGQEKGFNKETRFFTHRRAVVGETTCKINECRNTCDTLALIFQEGNEIGQTPYICNELGKPVFESPPHLALPSDFEDEHQTCSQHGNYFIKKVHLPETQRTLFGEEIFEYNKCGKTVCKISVLAKHQKRQTGRDFAGEADPGRNVRTSRGGAGGRALRTSGAGRGEPGLRGRGGSRPEREDVAGRCRASGRCRRARRRGSGGPRWEAPAWGFARARGGGRACSGRGALRARPREGLVRGARSGGKGRQPPRDGGHGPAGAAAPPEARSGRPRPLASVSAMWDAPRTRACGGDGALGPPASSRAFHRAADGAPRRVLWGTTAGMRLMLALQAEDRAARVQLAATSAPPSRMNSLTRTAPGEAPRHCEGPLEPRLCWRVLRCAVSAWEQAGVWVERCNWIEMAKDEEWAACVQRPGTSSRSAFSAARLSKEGGSAPWTAPWRVLPRQQMVREQPQTSPGTCMELALHASQRAVPVPHGLTALWSLCSPAAQKTDALGLPGPCSPAPAHDQPCCVLLPTNSRRLLPGPQSPAWLPCSDPCHCASRDTLVHLRIPDIAGPDGPSAPTGAVSDMASVMGASLTCPTNPRGAEPVTAPAPNARLKLQKVCSHWTWLLPES